jgi:hypothetical protein
MNARSLVKVKMPNREGVCSSSAWKHGGAAAQGVSVSVTRVSVKVKRTALGLALALWVAPRVTAAGRIDGLWDAVVVTSAAAGANASANASIGAEVPFRFEIATSDKWRSLAS